MNRVLAWTDKPTRFGALCLVVLVLVVCGATLAAGAVEAQDVVTPPAATPVQGAARQFWQMAEQLRSLTFEAQRALYAAERASQAGTKHDLSAQAVSHIEAATERYTAGLHSPLAAAAPAADAWIQEALVEARQAVEAANGPALSAARGRIWTGLLWGASTAALDALHAEDGARANFAAPPK